MSLHIRAIYAEGELTEAATIKHYLQVRPVGSPSRFSSAICAYPRHLRLIPKKSLESANIFHF